MFCVDHICCTPRPQRHKGVDLMPLASIQVFNQVMSILKGHLLNISSDGPYTHDFFSGRQT